MNKYYHRGQGECVVPDSKEPMMCDDDCTKEMIEKWGKYVQSLPVTAYCSPELPVGWLGNVVEEYQHYPLPYPIKNNYDWYSVPKDKFETAPSDLRRIFLVPIEAKQPTLETYEQEAENLSKLFELLVMHGGSIISSNNLSAEWINQARASGRMWVDKNGYGFVWEPTPKFPETVEEVEQFEKWFPLKIELPESLKSADWLIAALKRKHE